MKKAWNIFTTVGVVLVVLCAVFLMGSKIIGYKTYSISSGSMEPEYSVGDLIYVKEVEKFEDIKLKDPITFVMNEDLTVATHRVVRIDKANNHFYTKGDANNKEDSQPVHFKNVIGVPQFSIPYLGHVSDFVQNSPGIYITIGVGILLVIAVFLPDFKKKGAESAAGASGTSGETPSRSTYAASKPKTCKSCKHYFKDVDLPHPVCTLHEFHFESDFTPCDEYEE